MKKKDLIQLEEIFDDLKRGIDFLMEEKTILCRQYSSQTEPTTCAADVFTRKLDNMQLHSIDKRAGSELQYLQTGISALNSFLNKKY